MYRSANFCFRRLSLEQTRSRPFSVLTRTDTHSFRTAQFFKKTCRDQQVRFRRHDRASAFSKPRPKTKKQRQTYNRRIKRIEDEKAKHSAPGSRAGPRRQFIRERWQQLLDQTSGKELTTVDDEADEEYGIEDALMEDLLGNTSHLTSQPTPEPVYLGHMHQQYFDQVANQIEKFKQGVEFRRNNIRDGEEFEILDLSGEDDLPSDQDISKVLRAFRDRNGTRSRPIGIALALEHLLKELGVPINAFGEYTYTTLITCCRSPGEARRIMKLMNDQQHPISSYSWSILVDIHAKLGDFESCAAIIREMAQEGVPPSQAAYTSLLAACYKVCNDGRIPHQIRAKAGEVGWNHWQEMRIVGIDADAMAYGAIIRLCASRGQAERAINLLEEMHRFEVKPTTLCFSGALKAVARSHEIGVRFERGSSRKQLRRELFTAHHGKMARQIVIMAENAEVEQDEGFVSALMLCCAAAGDSATAKAVYLASEVRKMDHLRTIGPTSNFKLFSGEDMPLIGKAQEIKELDQGVVGGEGVDDVSPSGISVTSLTSLKNRDDVLAPSSRMHHAKSFSEREYGHDTRALSALLKACGQAMGHNGLGTMWAGQTNQGYLCENSLRLIATRWEPSYTKSSIPDELSTKVGVSSLRRYDEKDPDEPRKKGAARQKFRGLYLDEDSEELINEYATVYGSDEHPEDNEHADSVHRGNELTTEGSQKVSSHNDNNTVSAWSNMSNIPAVLLLVSWIVKWEERMRPFRFQSPRQWVSIVDISHKLLSNFQILPDSKSLLGTGNEKEAFVLFFDQLKEEALTHGVEEELTEEEARDMFECLKEEFGDQIETSSAPEGYSRSSEVSPMSPTSFSSAFNSYHPEAVDDVKQHDGETTKGWSERSGQTSTLLVDPGDHLDPDEAILAPEKALDVTGIDMQPNATPRADILEGLDDDQLYRIQELESALPGLPISRIKQVAKTFEEKLGYPSILSLVPVLRESFPDNVSLGWLKRMNTENADFVLKMAEEEGVVDVSLLNSMLQVKTSASSLLEAENLHRDGFRRHNLVSWLSFEEYRARIWMCCWFNIFQT